MQWRNSGFGFKNFDEVGRMFKTGLVSNFAYRFCGSQKDIFCLVYSQQLNDLAKIISLEELPEYIDRIHSGKMQGSAVVKL